MIDANIKNIIENYDYSDKVPFEELTGKKIISVFQFYSNVTENDIFALETDDSYYVMTHYKECCENVSIKEITDDYIDLLKDQIITKAEVETNKQTDDFNVSKWTFYKLATKKGHIDISWHGESTIYYSLDVNIFKISKDKLNF
jgi:hypothetical protein